MNDFLPLDQADQLIAELAGERVFAGRSKRMAQAGKLKISFHYHGPIGVFAPPEKPDEKPTAIKKYSFNGHLTAVAQPVLEVPTEEISSEGIKELHIDYLIAREVTLAEGSLPIELEPGQFIGRLNTKIVHTDGNKRITHAMDHLNSASVPERKWRIASDEIRAVFQKPTTPTAPADGQGTPGRTETHPIQRSAAQDAAIKLEIENQGFKLTALPKNTPGKSGVKAAIRAALVGENKLFPKIGKQFDKAWERLLASKEMAYEA